MINPDRDKLRAEIAGRVLAGIIAGESNRHGISVNGDDWNKAHRVSQSIAYADHLMNSLGLSEESEAAAIRKMADELRTMP